MAIEENRNSTDARSVTGVLMALLRSELCDDTSAREIIAGLSPDMLDAVYRLALRHSLEHLVADAIWKQRDHITHPEIQEKIKYLHQKFLFGYVRTYTQRDYAYEQLCRQLETDNITYIPLKGMELKSLWPEEWMRSCSDIDILIPEEELEAARASAQRIGFAYTGRSAHDISLFSEGPDRVHIELHYATVEEEYLPQAQAVLSAVWEYAEPTGQGTRWRLQPEMLYFYHVAHMAKHFFHGGCGIRFFLDLWLMEHKLSLDPAKKNKLLDAGGLRKFAEGCVRLSKVWIEHAPADQLTDTLEAYIVEGGIYGNLQNRVAVEQQQKRSYIFSRLFIPMSSMRERYPILKKCPFALPATYVHRIWNMIASGRMKKTRRELALNRTIPEQDEQRAKYLIRHLGL